MKLRAGDATADAKLKPAYDVLDRAVADHAFPGGVLAVGLRGELQVHAFGRQTYDASFTGSHARHDLRCRLTDQGCRYHDARGHAGRSWAHRARSCPWRVTFPSGTPDPTPSGARHVTVRHLLTHSSGLPAHKDYFLTIHSEREAIANICNEPLEYEPGTKTVYSDLGFILLGEILERVTGRTVDQLARERIFAPLGMANTLFNPPKALVSRIAPTENDATYRKRLLRGEVHDENAFAMGGVAGHAGMFATAPDLAAFCQMLLNGRQLRAPALADSRDARAIHRAAGARGQHAHAWMDGSHGGFHQRPLLFRATVSAIWDLPARRSGLTRTGSFSSSFSPTASIPRAPTTRSRPCAPPCMTPLSKPLAWLPLHGNRLASPLLNERLRSDSPHRNAACACEDACEPWPRSRRERPNSEIPARAG